MVAPTTSNPDEALGLLERSEHLEMLGESFDAVEKSRAGQLILVGGEAGVGKTILLRTFCAGLAGRARIVSGACDPLFTPRPLGPFSEIAEAVGGELERVVDAGAKPYKVAAELVRALEHGAPAVLVLEDVHWADEATLDVIRLIGRRAESVQALILASYRDDELDQARRLRIVIGELATAPSTRRLRLEPLSQAAVARLAAPYGADSVELYLRTGGNPFFVTEALAAREEAIPPTVRDAVLARAARLGLQAKKLLEAVAIVPPRADLPLLEALVGGLDDVEECLASGMLVHDAGALAFRHELARLAVEEAVAPDRKRALHRAALAALVESPHAGDAALLAHHAEAAGDHEAVLRFAPRAAARASALGAHREAAAQYARALRFSGALPPEERVRILLRRWFECYLTAQDEAALAAVDEALACYRELGDPRREGVGLRSRALVLANMGRVREAREAIEASVRLLEPFPPGRELAMTYAALAAQSILSEDAEAIALWAERTLELAGRLNDAEEASVSALGSLGAAEALRGGREGTEKLERALELATDHDLDFQVGRAYLLLGMAGCRARSLERMEQVARDGLSFCEEHDVFAAGRYLLAMRGWIELEQGNWDGAADTVSIVLGEQCTMSCVQARIVLGLLRARRGDPDPWTPLSRAGTVAEQTGQLWWLWQVASAKAEAAWLEGRPDAIREATESAYRLALERGSPWPIAELAWWRRRAGIEEELPEQAGGPFLHQLRGDWSRAAKAWQEAGCVYEEAVALGEVEDEAAQRRALDTLNRLGARPATAIVARRLRERGARGLPRGPRASTQANPAGLTARELEVLELVAEGLRNAEIAERLVLSQKTVDHHVSAILRKLDVRTRGQATAEAARRGLLAAG
jgi:DNA-binding CsgD family transcriptional regulator